MNAEQVRHARAMLADPEAAVTTEPAMVVPDGRRHHGARLCRRRAG
ncbi:hypothetical protein ACIPY6_38205 [Streptomyces sp. NPDC090054]